MSKNCHHDDDDEEEEKQASAGHVTNYITYERHGQIAGIVCK